MPRKTKRKHRFKGVEKAAEGVEEEESEVKLNVNKEYAEKYTKQQERAHLSRNRSKLEQAIQSEEEEEEESESEDDAGVLLNPELDVKIHEMIAAIRNKDKRLRDPAFKFFTGKEVGGDEPAPRKAKSKRKAKDTVKDIMRKQLLEGLGEEEEERCVPTFVQEQRELKDAFKAAVLEEEAKEEEQGLFKVRSKTQDAQMSADADFAKFDKEETRKEKQRREALSKLMGGAEPESKDEAFLRNYVLNEWWKKQSTEVPEFEDMAGRDQPDHPDMSAEEEVLDEQDRFEAAYNFRFEEEGGTELQSFPRQVQSLRDATVAKRRKRKDEARKRRLEERKKEEGAELKRLKGIKKKEIMKQLKQLHEISGLPMEDFADEAGEGDGGEKKKRKKKKKELQMLRAFTAEDLDTAFDPEKHDARMEALFGDEFHQAEVDLREEKRHLPSAFESEKERELAKKPGAFLKAQSEAEVKTREVLKTKMEEYKSLDYEDLIGGDLPTRFKYTQVPKCDYGMTLAEILELPDKELNQRMSLKKLAPYREDRGHNRTWWKKTRRAGVKHRRGRNSTGEGMEAGEEKEEEERVEDVDREKEEEQEEVPTERKKKKRSREVQSTELPKRKRRRKRGRRAKAKKD